MGWTNFTREIMGANDGFTATAILEVEEKDDAVIKVGNIYPSGGQNGDVYSVNGLSPTLLSGQGVKGRGIGSCNAPKVVYEDKRRDTEGSD